MTARDFREERLWQAPALQNTASYGVLSGPTRAAVPSRNLGDQDHALPVSAPLGAPVTWGVSSSRGQSAGVVPPVCLARNLREPPCPNRDHAATARPASDGARLPDRAGRVGALPDVPRTHRARHPGPRDERSQKSGADRLSARVIGCRATGAAARALGICGWIHRIDGV